MSKKYEDQGKLALFKAAVFSKVMVDVGRDDKISYLEGVEKHAGQQAIHFPPEEGQWNNFVAVWGRRTGKTIAAAMEVVAQLGVAKSRVWIVAPTYELTDRVFEYVWDALVIQKIYGIDSIVKSAKTPNNRYIELANGSFVKGKSGESPDSLIGEQLDLVVLDEAARLNEKVWTEQIRPTLVDRKGRALFISTPRGHNWFRDYYLRGIDPEERKAGWRSSRLSTTDNPFIDQDWVKQEKTNTPDTTWRQEYEASFEHRTGLVWPEYVDQVFPVGHLFDPADEDLRLHSRGEYTHFRAIDVGYRHPTACLWGAVDREGNVYIYQEYLEQDLDAETHAENINALTVHPVATTWISPDAKRTNKLLKREDGLNAWRIYRNAGILTRPASNELGPGLATVARYFRATREKNSTNPAIFISTECRQLRQSLLDYVFHEQTQQKDLDPPDKPRKYQDDLPDALRYLLATEPRYRMGITNYEPESAYGERTLNVPEGRYGGVRVNL